jgi:hypothetical protein
MIQTVADDASPPLPTVLPVDCATDEIARAPFCIRIDARELFVRGTTDSLGALRARVGDREAESTVGTRHLVRLDGLPDDSDVAISTWAVALDGALSEPHTLALVTTAPPLPNLRITEVLLHPFSTSAQQFVELRNDGDAPASTDGLFISNAHGSTALPAADIAPNARAIIVAAGYDPRGVPERGDPPAAPGTVVIRMPSTLGPHGLSERGADVWITDADGHTLTRAPSGDSRLPPRRGVSLVRADPRMREDDLASWAYDAGGGSTPGAPDSLR